MAKYRVITPFTDIEKNVLYTTGTIIDITEIRAKEIVSNLRDHNAVFIESVEKPKSKTKKKKVEE